MRYIILVVFLLFGCEQDPCAHWLWQAEYQVYYNGRPMVFTRTYAQSVHGVPDLIALNPAYDRVRQYHGEPDSAFVQLSQLCGEALPRYRYRIK